MRAEPLTAFCPRFQQALELVGSRWTGAIIRVLISGPQRFNTILTAVPGLSDRLLTERLKRLENEGIVSRSVSPGPPVTVSYELTTAGAELESAMRVLGSWAERWIAPAS